MVWGGNRLVVKWRGQWNKIAEFSGLEICNRLRTTDYKSFCLVLCCSWSCQSAAIASLRSPPLWFWHIVIRCMDWNTMIWFLCWGSPHPFTVIKFPQWKINLRANSAKLSAFFPLIYTSFALRSESDKLSCSYICRYTTNRSWIWFIFSPLR